MTPSSQRRGAGLEAEHVVFDAAGEVGVVQGGIEGERLAGVDGGLLGEVEGGEVALVDHERVVGLHAADQGFHVEGGGVLGVALEGGVGEAVGLGTPRRGEGISQKIIKERQSVLFQCVSGCDAAVGRLREQYRAARLHKMQTRKGSVAERVASDWMQKIRSAQGLRGAGSMKVWMWKDRRDLLLGLPAAVLLLCLIGLYVTRNSMADLSFLNDPNAGLVDQKPWQTVQALAPLAVSAEEQNYAQDAERLADHEVDQAFAQALREATAQAARPAAGKVPIWCRRSQGCRRWCSRIRHAWTP